MTSPDLLRVDRRVVFDLETDGLLQAVTVIHCAVTIDADTDEVVSYGPVPYARPMSEFYALYDDPSVVLIGHNIIGYDCAVIQKLTGRPIPPAERLIDTVNMAKLLFSDVKASDFVLAKTWKAYKAKLDLQQSAVDQHEAERAERLEADPDDDIGPYRGTAAGQFLGTPPKEFPGQFVGMHSLEAWGYRLGTERKGDYSKECNAAGIDPWAKWSPAMHDYMIQDAVVNLALYRHLLAFKPTPQSLLLEMRVQRLCSQIERNGWPFNVSAAETLYGQLCAERENLGQSLRSLFPPWLVQLEDFIPARANKAKGYVKGVPVPRTETIEFNPASRDHIVDRLKAKYGWVPSQDEYTDGGKPKIDDEILQRMPYPEAKSLARYFLIQKRIGQVGEGAQAWLKQVSPEGKIHGRYNTNGASTGRATHYQPNISQVPGVGAEFGRDCRALFHSPAGWLQVGADQAGLELRCLGSFIATFDSGAYIKTVLNGDIHWENAKALYSLPADTVLQTDEAHPDYKRHKKMRGVAKTFIYAFLYGAGPQKLGATVGITSDETNGWLRDVKHRAALVALKNRMAHRLGMMPSKLALFLTYKGELLTDQFLKAFPALSKLITEVKGHKKGSTDKLTGKVRPAATGAQKGWLKGLDGRTLPIRSAHSALNTLLQSAGAIICKQWIADAEDALVASGLKHGWDGDFVILGWIHDELQLSVRDRPGLVEKVQAILVATARAAGNPFPSWRCPTDGDTKVGHNWADCH